jgi:signal transduction histidine kinase
MSTKRAARVALPILIAVIAVTGLYVNASVSYAGTPHAKGGVLNLSEWNQKSVFEITGEWEFYWDRLLIDSQVENGAEAFAIVQAPGGWNYYETEFGNLPGFGLAAYRVRVIGARPGERYGLRVQNMASAYRLYADGELVGRNGAFGDKADAPVSDYRPQLSHFTAETDSFDIILQVSNDAYAVGGMWEPIVFGTYEQVSRFDSALSAVGMIALGGIAFISLFFSIFYAAQRQERDVLILAGIGALMVMRLTILGSMPVTYILPDMPIAGFGWIDYLTLIWAQFLLLYFIYCTYGSIVRKWQVVALLSYCALVSLCVIVLPFEVMMSTYMLLNLLLLFVVAFVTAQLARAAWRGQSGAPLLLGAMAFMLAFLFYEMFFADRSTGFCLLASAAPECMVLFIAQCVIVAQRYHRAQQIEISFLKSQIRPHFIHNSLNTIISISRGDADRARDLLSEFSSYLRGFYDYDSNELIVIGQELELVRAYAALEQARFGERVKVEYDIESERLLLPPLILQPLIENAFIHGLRDKEGGGTVVIYAKRTDKGKALVGVRDDGVGLRAKDASERQGVGIENINRRLTRMYRTQLVFSVPEGGGCEVCMSIPWKEAAVDARIPR